MADLYAVLEFNQASDQPDDLASLFWSLKDAREHAADMTRDSRARGRRERYRVYELVEVEDDEEVAGAAELLVA